MIAPPFEEERSTTRWPDSSHSEDRSSSGSVGFHRFLKTHPRSLTATALLLGLAVGWLAKRADFDKQ